MKIHFLREQFINDVDDVNQYICDAMRELKKEIKMNWMNRFQDGRPGQAQWKHRADPGHRGGPQEDRQQQQGRDDRLK